MSGGRCQRRKMMCRGADGGCGTEAKPCPVSRVTSNAAASTAPRPTPGVSLYVQARKALSERSPFDESEALSRVDTLPVALAAALVRSSEGRRKHRKAQAEGAKKAVTAPASCNVWTETEEYFRSITLADVDKLVARSPFGPDSALDSCLTMPLLRNTGTEETQGTFFTVVAERRNLSEACVDANETEDVLKSEMVDGVDAEQQQQRLHEDEQQKQQQVSEVDERRGHDGDRKEQQERQHERKHQQKPQATSISEHNRQHTDPACCVPTEKDEELVDYASMNWILASRNRTLLASERPNKKRKLLGSDAGLERVLLLPRVQGEGSPLCDYCCIGDYDSTSNRLLHCHACKVSVHMKCYGVHDVPQCAWFCSWCRQQEVGLKEGNPEGKDGRGPCFLCPKGGGALKPVETDMGGPTLKFAHLFCSLWMPELYVEDVERMEPIMNARKMQETKKRLVCNLCKVKQGACIRCSNGTCRTSFHPICARGAMQRMEIWGKYKCDDVELRAFCSKHSSFQEIGSLQCHRSHAAVLPDHSADGTDLSLAFPVSRITKIRITQKESDKDTGQEDIARSSPGSVIKNEITSEHDELANRLLPDNNASLSNHNTLASGGSFDAADGSASEADGLLLIVKKLTDHGEISIADVASHIQISSGSLESALVGETTPIPDELKLKLLKWFQDHVHSYGPLKNLVSGCKLPNAEVGGDSAKDPGLTSFDAVVAKFLPLQRKIKSNVNLLKDKAVDSSEGAPIYQICNGKRLDKMVEDWLPENQVDALSEFPSHDQDSCGKGEVLRKEVASCSEDGSFLQQQLCNGNSSVLKDQVMLVHHQQLLSVGSMPSFGSGVKQDGMPCGTLNVVPDSASVQEQSASTMGRVTPDVHAQNPTESCPVCVHPFIQQKLVKIENASEVGSCGLPIGVHLSRIRHEFDVHVHLPCTNHSQASDMDLQQLAKARGMGITELCPEDEVEGEILYWQNKLLDTTATIRNNCGNLMLGVVRHLPEELDSLKQKRWDLVVVNQFLRHIREAKKRGRKEKRHREYQAVLAAAAAAVETSSRVSSLRKESSNILVSSRAEVDAANVRGSTFPLASRVKEMPSKLAAPKISSGKQSVANTALCDVCGRPETMLNRIFLCGGCKVPVHLDCYRRPKNPISSWFCDVCEELRSNSPGSVVHCGLCGAVSGAFRKTVTGLWVHGFCAEWVLESTFRRGQEDPVDGMEAILKDKEILNCYICGQNAGVCIKCGYGHCKVPFHPYCARGVGLFMYVKTTNCKLQHKAYCAKHGTEQRQKADIQQYGAEELRSIKQIRVELEKVRLLCERIIRREKLKRELVLCSHDILASRRDYVAFSLLVNSSFIPPGISSESATTSVNNRSYSDTVQRSDDVTVDSSISFKRKSRLPSQMEKDRTEDSSTSRVVSARKGTDRIATSGKQIPKRPASATSRSSIDSEKRSKPKKQMEIFHKEIMMTSDQAAIQNRRLPKGFVYVPVDSLPSTRNIEAREPRRPDG